MMIRNRLKGLPTKSLSEFKPFQGHLKTLSKDRYIDLRSKMRDKGICAPVYIWGEWIIDGHQRIKVCETEGWEIEGGMPYVEVEAKDAAEAAEFVLIHSSEYADIDIPGLYEFGEMHGINWKDQSDLALPGVDMYDVIPAFSSESAANEVIDLAPKSASEYGGATSIARTSGPIKYWQGEGLLVDQVLDFGAGQEDHAWHKYDIVHHPDPSCLTKQWDTVMCNYVLNVQPSDHLITEIVALLRFLTKPKGKCLIAVRADLSESQAGRKGAYQNIKTVLGWVELLSPFFEIEHQETTPAMFAFTCSVK